MPAITQDSTYNAFPTVVRSNVGHHVAYRKGAVHVGDKGVIVCKDSNDNGATWSVERVIASDPVYDLRDPSIRQIGDGSHLMTLFAYSLSPLEPIKNSGRVYRSTDNCQTFTLISSPADGFAAWSAMFGPPVQLPDGRLIQGIYGSDDRTYSAATEKAAVLISSDGGLTWPVFELLPGNFTEICVGRYSNGTVFALLRHADGVAAEISRSVRIGDNNWSSPTVVIAGGSGKPYWDELVNGDVICVYRNGPGGNGVYRISSDIGQTFGGLTGLGLPDMFMYSDSVLLPDGRTMIVHANQPSSTVSDIHYLILGTTQPTPVLSHSPVAGTTVNPGSAVDLDTTNDPPPPPPPYTILLPSLVGWSLAAAILRIKQLGLIVGTIT